MLWHSSLHDVSQNFRHVLHTITTKQITFRTIIILMESYDVRNAGQNRFYLPTQIFSGSNLLLLRKSSKVHVVIGTAGAISLKRLLITVRSSLLTVEDAAGSLSYMASSFLHVLRACKGRCFRWGLPKLFSSSVLFAHSSYRSYQT